MARKVKDAALGSREARSKLPVRGKPYWRAIEHGVHVGYRRLKGKSGTWWARHYVGDQQYETESLGIADDLSDADGVAILDYWQAQTKARGQMVTRAHTAAGKTGPLMVEDACKRYLVFLENERKTAADARYRFEALVYPTLGSIECATLTADQIKRWHTAMARERARLRTRKGAKQNYRAIDLRDAEAIRRRKVSANRTLMNLKAALNLCWRDGLIPSDAAWRRVAPFKGVNAAKVRYLNEAECRRLINAATGDFKPLVQAALMTGARYSELARLEAQDLNCDAGTLAIRTSKTGAARHIVLTSEGVAFFKQISAGRLGHELLLPRGDGRPFGKSDQRDRMYAACRVAKITPPINFHGLRHTVASLCVMRGVPLMVVAKNLGHRDTRMVELHYGHLAQSYVVDAIRKGAPQFGFKPDKKIKLIGAAS